MEYFAEYGYAGLFAIAFLAATILPLGSEFIFTALLLLKYDPWICTIIATIGNTLGGMVNYYLGRLGKIIWIEKYLHIKTNQIRKVQNWLQYKGATMAFFSFLPLCGDLIPLALGFMRANTYVVVSSMLIGKFMRYFILMYSILQTVKYLGY